MKKFLKKLEVTDIKNLTNNDINKLEVGDVVAKNTNGQYHYYIVSYKQENVGICLTYSDATYLETISYDYVEGNWVYNSQDSTVVASKSYVDSLMSGALKRLIVEALPETDIDTNTIYMVLDESSSQQGNVYNEYLYINSAWELIGTTEVADTVIANPTLAGTEADLTGLQIGNTKYKVPQGGGSGALKLINIYFYDGNNPDYLNNFQMFVDRDGLETYEDLGNYLIEKGVTTINGDTMRYPGVGRNVDNGNGYFNAIYIGSLEPIAIRVQSDDNDKSIGNDEGFSITYLGQNQGE